MQNYDWFYCIVFQIPQTVVITRQQIWNTHSCFILVFCRGIHLSLIILCILFSTANYRMHYLLHIGTDSTSVIMLLIAALFEIVFWCNTYIYMQKNFYSFRQRLVSPSLRVSFTRVCIMSSKLAFDELFSSVYLIVLLYQSSLHVE